MSHRLLYPLFAATAAITLAACDSTSHERTHAVLYASIEQPRAVAADTRIFGAEAHDTRTTIIADQIPHPIVWSTGDLINIHFDADGNGSSRVFTLSEGAGTKYGKFIPTDIYGSSDSNVTMSPEPPTEYNYLFAGYPGQFISVTAQNSEMLLEPSREIFLGLDEIYDFPMIGAGGPDGRITFFCPFGIVHIPVTGSEPIDAIYLDTSAQQLPVSGRFAIDPESYTAEFVDSVFGNQFSISWNSTSAVPLSDTPTSFYAVVPPGTYEAGTSFQFILDSGETITKTTLQPFTVTRANILNLPVVDISAQPQPATGN